MPTTIITKYGTTAPTTSDVVQGELAVDTTNKRLYTQDGSSVIEIGTNPAANVTFGDNVKAVFGAGSDATLHSDGSAGYARGFVLQNTAGNKDVLTFVDGGATTLFHNNAAKIATTSSGIDVTGTATAASFETDAGGTFTTASGNDLNIVYPSARSLFIKEGSETHVTVDNAGQVGIGTSSPSFGLSVESDNGSGYAALFRKSSSDPALTIQTTSSITQIQGLNSALNATNDIAMQLSGGNVGINDADPSHLFTVKSDHATNPAIKIEQTGNTDGWGFIANNSEGRLEFSRIGGGVAGTHLAITNAGDVGIGTSTVDRGKLHVNHIVQSSAGAFSDPHIALSFSSAPTDNDSFAGISYATSDSDNYGWTVGAERTTSGVGDFIFTQHNNSATGSQRMAIDSSGVLLMGAPGGNSTGIIQGSSGAGGTNQPGTDLQLKGGSGGGTGGSKVRFFTAPGGSSGTAESAAVERMYIDEDGVAHFNGDVKVLSGDVIMGNGRGINFTATSDASGMTSETLDDYEEGTWTPTVSSGTVTVGTSRYTKVGRLVTCYTQLTSFSDTTSTTTVTIGGLPFAAEANDRATTLGVLAQHIANIGSITGGYLSSTSTLLLYNTSSSGFTNLQHEDLNGSSSIYISFSYFAA